MVNQLHCNYTIWIQDTQENHTWTKNQIEPTSPEHGESGRLQLNPDHPASHTPVVCYFLTACNTSSNIPILTVANSCMRLSVSGHLIKLHTSTLCVAVILDMTALNHLFGHAAGVHTYAIEGVAFSMPIARRLTLQGIVW